MRLFVCVPQAIEFWATLCDYELDLSEGELGPGEVNHRFIPAVCTHLVPVLLEHLIMQARGQRCIVETAAMSCFVRHCDWCCLLFLRAAAANAAGAPHHAGVWVNLGLSLIQMKTLHTAATGAGTAGAPCASSCRRVGTW